MSRAKATDVSSPISLFPFIGVLLSTMGALLVVLICVSRSARDSAVRDAAAQQAAVAADGREASREELEKIRQVLDQIGTFRSQAQERLRNDQLRLSHIEDHIRRTQEKAQSLQNAAVEMARLEIEHYDDHHQAEREVERLEQLIAATRQSIDEIRESNAHTKRSYAIIPYEGPHGTRRRPIYIECRRNEVLLQPEGIRLTPADFRPPLGAGNPLAAALRAAREYIVRQENGIAPGDEAEPYPLILVRPEGILAYYRVREAIESWDAAFGYELIDDDWKLEFPAANPLLADIEHQAVEQSRTRQQMLIAAAPRAYGPYSAGAGDEFVDDELSAEGGFGQGGGFGGGAAEGGSGAGGYAGSGGGARGAAHSGHAVDADQDGARGEFFDEGLPGDLQDRLPDGNAGGGGTGSPSSHPEGIASNGAVGPAGVGTANGGGTGASPGGSTSPGASGRGSGTGGGVPSTPQPGSATSIVAGSDADGASRGGVAPLGPGATGASLAGGVGEAQLMAANRADQYAPRVRAPGTAAPKSGEPAEHVPLDRQLNVQRRTASSARGHNWAVPGQSPSSVPIRRTIRVVVRSDRLAMPLDSPGAADAKEQEIPLRGPTAEQLDDFVAAVQDRVHEWGLAGAGMHWRPVLLLEADAAGQSRADDLVRLLRNSGIEVRHERAASRANEGDDRATR